MNCQVAGSLENFQCFVFQIEMGKIEWAMWANEQAVASSIGKEISADSKAVNVVK